MKILFRKKVDTIGVQLHFSRNYDKYRPLGPCDPKVVPRRRMENIGSGEFKNNDSRKLRSVDL